MYVNYRDFMKYWRRHLKSSESQSIFCSINIYTILQHLKAYWDSKKRGSIGLLPLNEEFEKRLVRELEGLIRNESPDFRIIKELSASLATSLRSDIILLLPEKKKTNDISMRIVDRMGINDTSIKKIDKILELCHEERFKRETFKRIFDSSESEKDSKYLTNCILRILVEEHSIDSLDKLPLQSFVRAVMDKYGKQIILAVDKDFEYHLDIFDNLQRFMHTELLPNLDNFRAQSMNREYSILLNSNLEHAIDYLREQLRYNIHTIKKEKNGKIILDTNFGRIARRAEKCFYYYALGYLIVVLDTPLREKLNSYLFKFFKERVIPQFSNFAFYYNDKVGPVYDSHSIKFFSSNMFSKIFVNMLIATSQFYPFNISNFSTKLKMIMDNFGDTELKDLPNNNSFVTNLRLLFSDEFSANFSQLIEIIKSISLDRLGEQQRKRMAIQMFLKELPSKIEDNHKTSFSQLSSVENIDKHLYSVLYGGKRKHRVFFALKGLRSDESLIDLVDVIVYNEKWNFQESLSFQNLFLENREPMDKFKFKIFCDITSSNNPYDALVEARQRCFDALSRITYTYFTPQKGYTLHFEPYHDIIEIPPKKEEMMLKMPQPVDVIEERFGDLKDLSNKSANNISLRRSLSWFAQGHYAITEYSEFLNYWLSFETILGIMGKFSTKQCYTIVIFVHALAEKPEYLERFLQQMHVSTEELQTRGETGLNSTVISVLKRLSGGDVEITSKHMLCFIETYKKELQYIFSRLFVINYIYARRNSLVHEGETFSFELGALSRILEAYAQVTINIFKDFKLH